MCGRYMITSPLEAVRALFGVEEGINLAPRYNVAPTQDVPVVRLGEDGRRHLAMLRWGLVPHWAADLSIGSKMINARGESVAEKPAFRDSFRHRRCLVVADGFYEWRTEDGRKQPYAIRRPDRGLFAMAGLWARWSKAEGAPVESCTIVTTSANHRLSALHERMPVVLDAEAYEDWLAGSPEEALSLIGPAPDDFFEFRPASPKVNAVRNDDSSLLDPTGGQATLL